MYYRCADEVPNQDDKTKYGEFLYLVTQCIFFLLHRAKVLERGIPISYVQPCHLLDYEHQLLPIVLSHCQYSLRHGQAQDIEYDLPALEKHIMDRFIHGKPLIQLEIPQVVYRKDVYTAATFANIRKKVHPQVSSYLFFSFRVTRHSLNFSLVFFFVCFFSWKHLFLVFIVV